MEQNGWLSNEIENYQYAVDMIAKIRKDLGETLLILLHFYTIQGMGINVLIWLMDMYAYPCNCLLIKKKLLYYFGKSALNVSWYSSDTPCPLNPNNTVQDNPEITTYVSVCSTNELNCVIRQLKSRSCSRSGLCTLPTWVTHSQTWWILYP